MRIGVVDMGSNSIRLQVIDALPGAAPLPIYGRKALMRLAEFRSDDGSIGASGQDALSEAVREIVAEAESLEVDEMLVFATAAIRSARDADEAIARIKEEVGLEVQVLSGEDEARLTFLAARRWLGWRAGPLVVLDIGGGSLEMARGRDEFPELAVSFPLGAGRLARDFLHHDPPQCEELARLRSHAKAITREVAGRLRWEGPAAMAVGTSGTLRHLARLTGAPPKRHGPFVPRLLCRNRLRRAIADLTAMKASDRTRLPGISAGRAIQMLAGAVVADVAMKALAVDTLEISPWALREGILLQRLDNMNPADRLHANWLVSAARQDLAGRSTAPRELTG